MHTHTHTHTKNIHTGHEAAILSICLPHNDKFWSCWGIALIWRHSSCNLFMQTHGHVRYSYKDIKIMEVKFFHAWCFHSFRYQPEWRCLVVCFDINTVSLRFSACVLSVWYFWHFIFNSVYFFLKCKDFFKRYTITCPPFFQFLKLLCPEYTLLSFFLIFKNISTYICFLCLWTTG